MNRRTFTRTAGCTVGLISLGAGVTAGHTPGESDDENAGNACHNGGEGNKDQEDQGESPDRNPECETEEDE